MPELLMPLSVGELMDEMLDMPLSMELMDEMLDMPLSMELMDDMPDIESLMLGALGMLKLSLTLGELLMLGDVKLSLDALLDVGLLLSPPPPTTEPIADAILLMMEPSEIVTMIFSLNELTDISTYAEAILNCFVYMSPFCPVVSAAPSGTGCGNQPRAL